MNAVIAQDAADTRQRFNQMMGLMLYSTIASINDGSGHPDQDFYDHSGTWDLSKEPYGFKTADMSYHGALTGAASGGVVVMLILEAIQNQAKN